MVNFDDIFEILSWSLAKPLHKFSTMAKICKDFLSEPFFIEKQCCNSSMKPEESLIIQDNSCLRNRADKLEFFFLLDERDGCYNKGVPKKSLDFLRAKARILSSSNGLILCWTIDPNKATKLILCNPITKTWLPIDLPNEELVTERDRNNTYYTLVCGNLFGNKNKKFPLDYTILAFIKYIDPENWNNCGYDLYILEQGEWLMKGKNLPTGSNDLNFIDQCCCKNGVFYISEFGLCYDQNHPKYWPYVVHFDIENGSSKIVPLPEEARVNSNESNSSFRVFGWDSKQGNSWFESICLVKYSDEIITIWVFKAETKDKKLSPWSKILSFNIIDDLGLKNVDSRTNSFTILNKKMIFADSDGLIYRFCFKGGNCSKIEKIFEYDERVGISGLRFNAYTTTIRPCLKDTQDLL